jgi:SWI/SNF-related matrix-associated actin-dependent regulator of chromatin subfamily A3
MKKGQYISIACSFLNIHLQVCIYRIPYVRFDGRMSAKRRQETLETFCVPIGNETRDTSNVQSIPTFEVEQTRRSKRSSRQGEANSGEYQQENPIPTNSDDDDDFVLKMDVESDDGANGTRPRGKKGKGKGKAKGKSKAGGTRSRVASAGDTVVNGLPSNGVNPKVMLISLKAGALGLNLTVANNIYL